MKLIFHSPTNILLLVFILSGFCSCLTQQSQKQEQEEEAQQKQQQRKVIKGNQQQGTLTTESDNVINIGAQHIVQNDNNNNRDQSPHGSLLSLPEVNALLIDKKEEEEQQQKNNNDDELTVVIHIGPMKTGSSSIQKSFVTMIGRGNAAEEVDNYEDSGLACGPGLHTFNFIGCFRPPDKTDGFIICKNETLELVQKVATERKHNLIISAEYLTSPDTNITKLKEFLDPYWKKHKIVAYYRRYYDWLYSFHNQGNKKLATKDRQPIHDFYQKEAKSKFWWNMMYLIEPIKRWKEYYTNFEVINIYEIEDGDVRESFYCQALPNATNACNKFRMKKQLAAESNKKGAAAKGVIKKNQPRKQRRRRTTEEQVNPSVAFIYEDLAYYAYEMNLWNNQTALTIQDVAVQVKYYQEKVLNLTKYDFGTNAMICPNEETLNYLLKQSLDTERTLFPEYYDKRGANDLITDFNIMKKTKLCHIDAQIVLQNNYNNWQQFFQNQLKKPKKLI